MHGLGVTYWITEDLRVARSSIKNDSLPSSNYPVIKPMTGKVVDPTARPAVVILLNGHAVNLPLKLLCLHLWAWVVLSLASEASYSVVGGG